MLSGVGVPRHVLRRHLIGHARHADRRVHSKLPQVGLIRPDRSGGGATPASQARPSSPPEADAVMPKAASLAAIMAANCSGARVRRSTATISDNRPGSGVSSNRAGSTYSRRSRTAFPSAARRSSRVQSRAAYSADTNTTTVAARSP